MCTSGAYTSGMWSVSDRKHEKWIKLVSIEFEETGKKFELSKISNYSRQTKVKIKNTYAFFFLNLISTPFIQTRYFYHQILPAVAYFERKSDFLNFFRPPFF